MQAEDLQDDYDDGIIRQIFRTTRAFSRTLNGVVTDDTVHSSEWMVLNLVMRTDSISQAELINRLGVEPAAISRTLGRLSAKGLISHEGMEGDRRKVISLTDKGREVTGRLAEDVKRHRQQALQGLNAHERQQLMGYMLKIEENLRHYEK